MPQSQTLEQSEKAFQDKYSSIFVLGSFYLQTLHQSDGALKGQTL
jgi:hypothetical protein